MSEEKTMSDKWLQKIYNGCDKISSTGYALSDISNALEISGNMILAKNLDAYSKLLLEAVKQINHATGECISEQIQKSGKNSMTILNAALSGAFIANNLHKSSKNKKRNT